MAWSVEQWQEDAAQHLRRIGAWIGHKTPFAVYSALCGLSLWPLVEAAQGEGLMPVVSALAGVAGAVGGNLIAEQIQRWRDGTSEPTAESGRAAVEWVARHAPADADLRQALDDVLETLGSLPAAQAALAGDERAAFDAALRRELARLGNLERFAAELEGAGAIAQGAGARAVGQSGAWVEGDVGGDVVTGPRHTDFDMRGQTVMGPQINVKGNLVLGPWPEGGHVPSASDPGGERPYVSAAAWPEGWDRARVRSLLTAALSDHDLEVLCYDHFAPAYPEFSEGMGKAQKIQRLLAYCERRDELDRLLRLIEEQNPAQYRRFRPC